MKQVRIILFSLALLFGASLFVGQFFLDTWLGDIINNFRQQYIVIYALLVSLAVLFRDKLFVAAFSFFVLFFVLLNINQISPQKVDNNLAGQYSLTTFNVYINNHDTKKIVDKLKQLNSDILVLEEVSANLFEILKDKLSIYPYYAIDGSDSHDHVVIMSRYPIIQLKAPPQFAKIKSYDLINVLCQLPRGVVRVIGVHLSNPLIFGDFEQRGQEFNAIAEYINGNSDNLILAGDFNTTTWSSYMVRFLKNSHLQIFSDSVLFKPTWLRKVPLVTIPIDHVLFGIQFKVKSIDVSSDPVGSDHHPLTVLFDKIESKQISLNTNNKTR